jgi:hypothetical protein
MQLVPQRERLTLLHNSEHGNEPSGSIKGAEFLD